MATISYANINSGKLAYAIGWINLGNIPLTPPTQITHHDYILPRGDIFSFDISSTGSGVSVSTQPVPTWSGAAMGNSGYLGITGNVAVFATGNGSVNVPLENIILKTPSGEIITNYALYLADAEATRSDGGEGVGFQSDGGPITQVDVYPSNLPCPNAVGNGTSTITIGFNVPCTGAGWNSRIFQTTSPNSILGKLLTIGGNEAFALGLSYQKITLIKDIQNRIYPNDQFQLNLNGPVNLSTITTGIISGTQPNTIHYFGGIGDIFSFNESMSSGSTSQLNSYIQTISIVNTSGGSIPNNVTFGSTIPLNVGDFLEITIKNTPIPPIITPVKTVNYHKAFQGQTLTYTIVLPNTFPNPAINTILIDTTPIGTTFVHGSVTINGVNTTDALPNINVFTIPSNSTTTVTFDVTIDILNPKISPIVNGSYIIYNYPLVTQTLPTLSFPSNTVQTIVFQRPGISSTKFVDKSQAKFNEILTYTIVFTNTGQLPLVPLTFIDTIPFGSTFIPNTLKVNGNILNGTPNPPGATIISPTIIDLGKSLTVSFQVTVNTIVNPTTIINYGGLSYSYTYDTLPINSFVLSNPVETLISFVDVTSSKYVNKNVVKAPNTVLYTVVFSTYGNLFLNNVIFIDTLPTRASFIPSTLTLNGITLPFATLNNGASLGNIPPNSLNTITFLAQII